MPQLQKNPTLALFQDYVKRMEVERGFTNNSLQNQCLFLGEEVGELFKAVRKVEKHRLDSNSKVGEVDEELADIFIYVCSIANRLNIDLETAIRKKEARNHQRSWQ